MAQAEGQKRCILPRKKKALVRPTHPRRFGPEMSGRSVATIDRPSPPPLPLHLPPLLRRIRLFRVVATPAAVVIQNAVVVVVTVVVFRVVGSPLPQRTLLFLWERTPLSYQRTNPTSSRPPPLSASHPPVRRLRYATHHTPRRPSRMRLPLKGRVRFRPYIKSCIKPFTEAACPPYPPLLTPSPLWTPHHLPFPHRLSRLPPLSPYHYHLRRWRARRWCRSSFVCPLVSPIPSPSLLRIRWLACEKHSSPLRRLPPPLMRSWTLSCVVRFLQSRIATIAKHSRRMVLPIVRLC